MITQQKVAKQNTVQGSLVKNVTSTYLAKNSTIRSFDTKKINQQRCFSRSIVKYPSKCQQNFHESSKKYVKFYFSSFTGHARYCYKNQSRHLDPLSQKGIFYFNNFLFAIMHHCPHQRNLLDS